MPDYADLLAFLANNPPQRESERRLHASLLELMAQCLRSEETAESSSEDDSAETLEEIIEKNHIRWVRYN
ncbi:MAG: hypothetical protein AAGF14_03715 [Pseudomonadota bacterium]